MFYFDLPHLHKRTEEGKKFIEALTVTNDGDLFKTFPVQALINYHWQGVKYQIITF